MGKHHPAAADAHSVPHAQPFPGTGCFTDTVGRGVAGGLARTDVRVSVAVGKRFGIAVTVAIAKSHRVAEKNKARLTARGSNYRPATASSRRC